MLSTLLMLLLASPSIDPRVEEAEARRVAAVERAAPSVVAIFPPSGAGGGSGVLISADGYALSNHHVTGDCGAFMKCGLNDGQLYDAVIVGIDPTGDVALIQLLGRSDFPAAALGDSDLVRAGDFAFAMGNPFVLANDFQPTLTCGVISGVHRYQYPAGTFLEYADSLQTDASINPGNSGGPLFNARGEVIGINGRCSFEKRGRVNVGVGYAISINQIQRFIDQLKGGRVVDHASLGAVVRTGRDRTVVVDQVLESSAAYRRGLREGDELLSFAGRSLGSVNQFKNVLGAYPHGWTVPISYRRKGQLFETRVPLAPLHHESEMRPHSVELRPKPRGPRAAAAEETPVPEQHLAMFEAKPGYANYRFNRVERSRALRSLDAWKNAATWLPRWKIAGTVYRAGNSAGEPFHLILAGKTVGMRWKDPFTHPLDGSPWTDEPPRTGGLLAAFAQFKRLLVNGIDGFHDAFYFGSEPLDGDGPGVDVVVSRVDGLETRWYFHQASGLLAGWDASLSQDVDPCEIRVAAFADFNGVSLPATFEVRHAAAPVGRFEVKTWEFLPEAESK